MKLSKPPGGDWRRRECNLIHLNDRKEEMMNLVKKNTELRPFYSSLLDDFWNTGFLSADEKRGIPALNVKEDDKELSLELKVPGLKRDDIKLEYTDGILTLSGEKNEEKEEKDKDKYVRREFTSFAFRRSFELPEERYNVAKAEASYKDGILEIKLPKKEQKGKVSRQIEVK